jgi:hypothetical protein
LIDPALAVRIRAPEGGGRSTDPAWTERRLVPFAPETLTRLEALARAVSAAASTTVGPLQIAALLVERGASTADGAELAARVRRRKSG